MHFICWSWPWSKQPASFELVRWPLKEIRLNAIYDTSQLQVVVVFEAMRSSLNELRWLRKMQQNMHKAVHVCCNVHIRFSRLWGLLVAYNIAFVKRCKYESDVCCQSSSDFHLVSYYQLWETIWVWVWTKPQYKHHLDQLNHYPTCQPPNLTILFAIQLAFALKDRGWSLFGCMKGTWWSGLLLCMACMSPIRFNWLLCKIRNEISVSIRMLALGSGWHPYKILVFLYYFQLANWMHFKVNTKWSPTHPFPFSPFD